MCAAACRRCCGCHTALASRQGPARGPVHEEHMRALSAGVGEQGNMRTDRRAVCQRCESKSLQEFTESCFANGLESIAGSCMNTGASAANTEMRRVIGLQRGLEQPLAKTCLSLTTSTWFSLLLLHQRKSICTLEKVLAAVPWSL